MRAKVLYMLASDCPSVELIAADYRSQRFSAHWHQGYSIGVVTHSAQRLQTLEREWSAGPGDLILLNPGQVHDGSGLEAGGWSSRMAYVPPAAMTQAIAVGTRLGSGELHFRCPVVRAPGLANLFEEWHACTEAANGSRARVDTLKVLATIVQDLVDQRLASVVVNSGTRLERERNERLLRLVDLCPSEVVDTLCTADWAPRTTVWRQLQADFGLGPRALRVQVRLARTKMRIAEGLSIADAAIDAGYHDQAHFTRQFVSAYGMTPAQFRTVQQSIR